MRSSVNELSRPVTEPRIPDPRADFGANGDVVPGNPKVSILLVDDRPDKLLALESLLSGLGQNLVKARSGKEALKCLLRQDFALILLDVSMPGMDGFETASLIRQRPRSEHTPIIFVTSINETDNHIAKGYSLGAVDYILSPIAPEILKTKVAVFVELYKKTEQIKAQAEQLRRIEELQHQKSLAEAVDRLEAETKRNRFFTLAVDMLGIGDFDGRLLQVNPAWEKMLGFSEEELKNFQATELVHPDDSAMISERVSAMKKGLAIDYFEIRCKHKDGSFRWVGWTAAPFPAEQLVYIFGRDITARKEAEDKIHGLNEQLTKQVVQLTRINQELERFTYSISHDLRSPLRAMEGYAHTLLQEHAPNLGEEATDYAQRILNSSVYMDRMLQDLLEYSRLDHSEALETPVSLEELLQEILDNLASEATGQQAEVRVDRPLPLIRADPITLRQVLINLLTNALKFVDPSRNPHVHIWSSTEAGRVKLWVEDNGIGIAPEHQERIFGLFQRLHAKSAYPGTGVGLALVQKGVERMNGQVGVESRLGEGSRFWVELPAARSVLIPSS
ncbi:MAG: response regulator [Opitutaceae bacterium]|nr:response regulator [Verrucomicrobiales bacterium]